MTHTTDNTTMPSWAEHNLHQRIKAKEKAIATTKPTEPTIDEILEITRYNLKTSPDEIFDKGVVINAKNLIEAHIAKEVAKARIEAFDVAFDCHDYDRLRAYRAELLKEVK